MIADNIKEKYPFLMEHQIIGVNTLIQKKRFALCDDMGLGKTLEAFCAADYLYEQQQVGNILIICPNSIKNMWQDEIKKFLNQDATIINGSPKNRKKIYENMPKWAIINYELAIRDDVPIDPKTLIICDEASKLKNFKTKTYKKVHAMRKNTSFIFCLTGTPLENNLINFYNIINILSPYYMMWDDFSAHYIIWEDVWVGDRYIQTIKGYKNLDVFAYKISQLFLRRRKNEVKDLPPKIMQNRFIVNTNQQNRLYNFYVDRALQEKNSGGIFNKLQILRMVDDDPYLIRVSDSDGANEAKVEMGVFDENTNKFEELKMILNETESKVVIFTQFAKMAEYLSQKLKDEYTLICITGEDRDKDAKLKEFKAGNYKILISTDTLAYGVSIDEADVLVNFDLHWNPAILRQRSDRIHRITSTRQKIIVNLIGEGIEKRVFQIINYKQALFDKVVEGTAISDENFKQMLVSKIIAERSAKKRGE